MANTPYTFSVRNSGALTAALTPAWISLRKLSDGTSVADPGTVAVISEIGGGLYKVVYDPEGANGELAGVIDAGAGIAAASERYIEMTLAQDSSRVTRLDAAISSRSTLTAANVWDYLTSAATTVGSLGKRLVDFVTGDAFARLGAPAGASVSADIAAIAAKTTNLPSDPADASVIAARFDTLDTAVAAAGLTTDQGTLLDRIAAAAGVGLDPDSDTGWQQTATTDTITRVFPLPSGGTMTQTATRDGNTVNISVTYEA